ncbi:MAG: RNA-binding S4 domain-containing protein [Paracoccaceae bacterium]
MAGGAPSQPNNGPRETIRIDKWLWFARFFKTRTLAAKTVSGGHLRLNGAKIAKPATAVGAGDTITFLQGRDIREIRIQALGVRRGPAPEAQTLYEDLAPKPAPERSGEKPQDIVPRSPRYEGKGRPTKKERRNALLYRPDMLE